MTLTLNNVLQMAWRTILNPREGAEEVLALGVPRQALWTILFLVIVLSIMLGQISNLLMTQVGDAAFGGLLANPVATGMIQLALLVVAVYAIYGIGRAFGGTGSFDEALLLVSWLQFIMVCIQVVQTVFMVILPPLAAMIGVAGLFLFLWLLTNFVAVIHGFRSLGQVFVMILLSTFVLAFFLSLILSITGVVIPEVPTNA